MGPGCFILKTDISEYLRDVLARLVATRQQSKKRGNWNGWYVGQFCGFDVRSVETKFDTPVDTYSLL